MVVLSPAVWVKTFGFPRAALFPYDNPALFSMAIAFVGIWLFSDLTPAPARVPSREPSRRNSSGPKPASARKGPWHTEGLLGRSGMLAQGERQSGSGGHLT